MSILRLLAPKADTPAPGKVIFDVEQNIHARSGFPAALQAVNKFLAECLSFVK